MLRGHMTIPNCAFRLLRTVSMLIHLSVYGGHISKLINSLCVDRMRRV